jgi:hypothetical protein
VGHLECTGEVKNACRILMGYQKGRGHMGVQSLDVKIILK